MESCMIHTESSSELPTPGVNGRLVTRPAFHVVGLQWKAADGGTTVAKVCAQARLRLPEIRYVLNAGFSVGVSTHDRHKRFSEYILGQEVSRLDEIPQGMVGITIPPQTYVVFTYRGPLSQLPMSTHYADGKRWLAQHAWQDAIADGAYWFEQMDERVDKESAEFTLHSFTVLKPKLT
jgi:predicted transcriptional regulator YdeE